MQKGKLHNTTQLPNNKRKTRPNSIIVRLHHFNCERQSKSKPHKRNGIEDWMHCLNKFQLKSESRTPYAHMREKERESAKWKRKFCAKPLCKFSICLCLLAFLFTWLLYTQLCFTFLLLFFCKAFYYSQTTQKTEPFFFFMMAWLGFSGERLFTFISLLPSFQSFHCTFFPSAYWSWSSS